MDEDVMFSEKRFNNNLRRLQRMLPKIAIQLPYVDCDGVLIEETRSKEPNLVRVFNGKKYPLHSNYSAQKEAETWFAGLDLTDVQVLYVHGVGLGYGYDAAKKWLQEDPERYLVFLEHDMAVFHRLLETEKGTEILDDKQVQIHIFTDLKDGEPMFEWLCWYFVLSRFDVTALPAYGRDYSDLFQELRIKISHDAVVKNSIVGEYMRFGSSFYRNFYLNLLSLERSYFGNALFDQFQNVPAVICGAGPSLNKNIDVLKTLTDRALIFAGGSGMNVLNNYGLTPHFGAGIDPNPLQYARLISNQAYEVPYFYRGRMFHEAFKLIHGPRLYVTGTGGYYTADWFEEMLGIEGEYIDEGHNVVNFCIEIANALGCNPIVLVGLDLAYTGMSSYADGVIKDAKMEEEEIKQTKDLDSSAFLREDINGELVYTLWKWVAESEWISEFAKRNPEREVINATEGGLGFKGIPNMTLSDVKEKYLKDQSDLRGLVRSQIENAEMTKVTAVEVLRYTHQLYTSLDRTVALCDKVLEEIELMKEKLEKTKKTDGNLQTAQASLLETDIQEEVAFESVLNVFAVIYTKVLARETHLINYDRRLKAEWQRDIKRLEINGKKFQFLKDVAEANKKIIMEAVEHHHKLGLDVRQFEPLLPKAKVEDEAR